MPTLLLKTWDKHALGKRFEGKAAVVKVIVEPVLHLFGVVFFVLSRENVEHYLNWVDAIDVATISSEQKHVVHQFLRRFKSRQNIATCNL